MRVRYLMGVVATMAVLAGCGQGAAGERPEGPAASSPAPEQTASVSQEQAEAALLGITDLPDGWMLAPPDSGGGAAGSDDSAVWDPAECDQSDMPGEESVVDTSKEYLGPSDTTFEMRVQSGLSDPPEEVLDTFAEFVADCPVVSAVTSTLSVRAEQALTTDFPELGERTLAVSQAVENSDGGYRRIDIAQVVVEESLITFTAIEPYEYGYGFGDDALREFAPLGMERFQEAAG